MKKNSKNKLKQVCMFVEKLGKKLVSLSFFLSFFTRGFARRLKDDAHIPNFQDTRFRAHISNTRFDPVGSTRRSPPIPRTSFFVRVFQTLELTF